MQRTKIEWAERVWNPITGCTKVSEGCRNCYAARMARRLAGRCGYPEAPHHFDVTLHPGRLKEPLCWKKPSVIFVCSMGDLFHERVMTSMQLAIMDTMAKASQHTFVVLTKRPQNMVNTIKWWCQEANGPLPDNIWLGVTVEDQETADERIPQLLQIPVAHYWVSYEPALGPVDLAGPLNGYPVERGGWHYVSHEMAMDAGDLSLEGERYEYEEHWDQQYQPIEFVVAGGESGPGARPAHPDWFKSVRDQCGAAELPFMFKAWGEWIPRPDIERKPQGSLLKDWRIWTDDVVMERVGKKRAGRLLDGVEHMETPWGM